MEKTNFEVESSKEDLVHIIERSREITALQGDIKAPLSLQEYQAEEETT